MDLTKVTVALRPRRPWEAVDLGIRMARRWYWPLLRVWLILTLPFWLALHLLPDAYLWVVPFILWWSKPVWERALLHILSQVVFGALPSTRDTLRAFPRLVRSQIIAALTWRRLSPFRSMDLPVTQLEGLNGRRRSDRLALLRQQDAGPAGWLTVIGVHLEGFLGFAVLLLIWALIPSTVDLNLSRDLWENPPFWLTVVQNLTGYAAIAVVAPFYVASGFALYLNRRVLLEGWDVELAFRQMLQKRGMTAGRHGEPAATDSRQASRSTQTANTVASCVAAVLLAALVALPVPPASAAEPPQAQTAEPLTPAMAREAIDEVLKDEAFNQTRTLRFPKFEPAPEWDFSFPEFSIPWVAPLLEAVFWMFVVLLLGIIALRYSKWLQEFGLGGKVESVAKRPETLFGLDLRPESLPNDVPNAVRKLWQQQDPRGALALLYRASLVELMDADLAIRPGYTEEDCLRLVRRQCEPMVHEYFGRVTRLWQRQAYSHRSPATTDVEALCEQWHSVWAPAPLEASTHA